MKCENAYKIEYNGKSNDDFGVFLYDFPVLTLGEKNYDTYAVSGRRGELVGETNYISNASLSITFSVISDRFCANVREIMNWLTGAGKLKTSDDPDCYYSVLKVNYGDIDREIRKYGRFTVNFVIDPYLYRDDGDYEYADITYNLYAECKPIYKITGEGMCTLTVNGKTMTANVGQNLTIDTDRMIAYRQDGTLQNTAVTGDYEKLWLPRGSCVISITTGFLLKIIPKWGYCL